MLHLIRQENPDWRQLATESWDGRGSRGNGAAMRVAPLGTYFADDPQRAATEAALSAEVTHTHPEGVAGAVAASAGSDVDTICAIVGGITAARLGTTAIPTAWGERCEPLPAWAEVGQRA